MPRISEERREQRRRHILTSAWRCFARDGFHATSMDDVIAASGLSASGVYRYFRSKDELIDAAGRESMRLFRELFDRLLGQRPPPTRTQLLAEVVAMIEEPPDDLSRIAVQAWAEALRRPSLAEHARDFHAELRADLTTLAGRWDVEDPEAVATLLATLLPGLLIAHHVLGGIPTEALFKAF
ncbi:TetR/AcrR family transcriptional regulator [Kutzneria sp. 744]|uniref:TetR/AcrR family transcriptional regulator n=1 Tax=Kutzneria sp. (strain 744) TaxID=345341 RepID=UPI0003EED5F5|nr:TetR/AcrR family transcriptional regulator [Kutzneria sp. 744]EWM12709.1 transcriptional regulator [Kutzneria sp. 744]